MRAKVKRQEINKGVIIFFGDCVMLYHAEHTFTQNRFPVPLCFCIQMERLCQRVPRLPLCSVTSLPPPANLTHALTISAEDHPSH